VVAAADHDPDACATHRLNSDSVIQQTVRKWIDESRIPHPRVGHGGRRVRVYKSDFAAFVSESYEKKKQAKPSI
jgi:excisionase family DNA binding protein